MTFDEMNQIVSLLESKRDWITAEEIANDGDVYGVSISSIRAFLARLHKGRQVERELRNHGDYRRWHYRVIMPVVPL